MPLAPLDTLLPSLLRNKSQNNCLKPQNASGIAPGEEEERQSDLGKLVKTQTTLSGFSAGEEMRGHMVGLGSPHPLACGRRCSTAEPVASRWPEKPPEPCGNLSQGSALSGQDWSQRKGTRGDGSPIRNDSQAFLSRVRLFPNSFVWTPFLFFEHLSLRGEGGYRPKGPTG